MNILGVSFLSDASAAVLSDGRLVSAVSEERLNRIKMWNGIPDQAIQTALSLAGITLDDVDLIATHGAAPASPDATPFHAKEQKIQSSDLSAERQDAQLLNIRSRYNHESMVLGTRTPGYLNEIRKLNKPMRVFAHHEAHAASAYYGSAWDECVVMPADGWGEDASSTLSRGVNGQLENISRSYTFDSLGYFYGSITKALGFVPHRHECKVLGLAAYCKTPRSYSIIKSMVDYDTESQRFIGCMENGIYVPRFENPYLKARIQEYSREDVSSATQQRLEEVVCSSVAGLGDSARRLALGGGIFANVQLNQRLLALPNVDEVFVFPNMGDGGLSVGAAWLAHVQETGCRPDPLSTVYLGSEESDAEISSVLSESGLSYVRVSNICDQVADLLAKGHVVARFDGRMEFGPRALGNRSILYHPIDPSVNEWLNQRLSRSEFMPFAPATLEESAESCFDGFTGGRQAAYFMTMTFDCTRQMKDEAPATIHVDGTARPQIVSPVLHKQLYEIVDGYRRRTGRSSVINTSFNLHEEPIVCTIKDALRALKASRLPYLAAGNFLVQTNEEILQ